MIQKKKAILTGMAVVTAALILIFFLGGEKEKIKPETASLTPKDQKAGREEGKTRTVTLFFLSDDDDLFHPEDREIAAGASMAEDVESAIMELVKGSERGLISPLPPETKVRQVFVAKDGTAYVDFTKDITENFSYGASSEMSAVYALVNTLAFNFGSIKKVTLLIEGAERETLGGHIDLSKPFFPQSSLIAK